MKLTKILAAATAAPKPRPDQGGTLSTLMTKIKSDVERLPYQSPELTEAQRQQQARNNSLFIADHILAGEPRTELADLWASFRADFGPTGAIEEEMIRHATGAAWVLRRVDRIERQIWANYHRPIPAPATHAHASLLLGDTFQRFESGVLARLDQFRKIGERRWNAAIKQLTQYRKATGRKGAALSSEMQFEREAEHAPLFPDGDPTLIARAPEPALLSGVTESARLAPPLPETA